MLLFKLPSRLEKEAITLLQQQIYYTSNNISDVAIDNGRNEIVVHVKGDTADLQAKIQTLIERTIRSYRKVSSITEFVHKNNYSTNVDPQGDLIGRGDVVQIMPGVFTFSGEFLDVFNALNLYFKGVAEKYSAIEKVFPYFLPVSSMINNGYLQSFPQHAMLVSLAHQDLNVLSEISKIDNTTQWSNDMLSSPSFILSPTVCHHCFEELKGKVISENVVYTSLGKCYRYEGPKANDLSRSHVFNMREIVFFGEIPWVHKSRIDLKNQCIDILKSWDLSFQVVTATDPFFPVNSEGKRSFQALNASKYEFQLYLAHKDTSISAISVNNHMDSLVKPYSIDGGEQEVISSCVGFGLDRFVYTLYAQFGMDLANWPAQIKEDLCL